MCIKLFPVSFSLLPLFHIEAIKIIIQIELDFKLKIYKTEAIRLHLVEFQLSLGIELIWEKDCKVPFCITDLKRYKIEKRSKA